MTADDLAAIVREHTERAMTAALAPLLAHTKALDARILELETRPAELGPTGAKGDPGLQGVGIASVLISAEGRLVAHLTDGRTLDAGPVPRGLDGKDGAPGQNGKDGANGLDGKDGAPGQNGKDGANGLDGKDGRDGLDGKDGAPGLNGIDGPEGIQGKDGIGVMDAVLDREGHLVLTLSDGRTKNVGLVTGRDADPVEMKRLILDEVAKIPQPKDGLNGKDGAPGLSGKDGRDGIDGKDGADGMTLDDAELICDDEAGWIFRLSAGGRTKDFPIPLPHDVGPWTAGATYPAGAGVSWDGGYWIAKRVTREQPGSDEHAWRLVVRRGKQGKEGLKGKDGKDGQDFRPSNTPPIYG